VTRRRARGGDQAQRGGRARTGGQALAELAIVIPILILLVMVLVDLGRTVFAYNAITNGAREGARLAIVNQDEASVRERALAQAPGSAATATVAYFEPGPNADPETNPPCATREIGCLAVVTLQTRVRPLVSAVIPLPNGHGFSLGTLVFDLEARSVLPVEFTCPTSRVPEFDTVGECPRQP